MSALHRGCSMHPASRRQSRPLRAFRFRQRTSLSDTVYKTPEPSRTADNSPAAETSQTRVFSGTVPTASSRLAWCIARGSVCTDPSEPCPSPVPSRSRWLAQRSPVPRIGTGSDCSIATSGSFRRNAAVFKDHVGHFVVLRIQIHQCSRQKHHGIGCVIAHSDGVCQSDDVFVVPFRKSDLRTRHVRTSFFCHYFRKNKCRCRQHDIGILFHSVADYM